MRQLTHSILRAALLRASGAVAVALSIALSAAPASAAGETVVSSSGASAVVDIQSFKADGAGTVSATLVNKSSRTLRNVQLVVRYTWLWKNERSPGKDDPGRSDFYTVPGEIAPGGSLPFTYRPATPLPKRSDGTFDISAQVVAFTEVGE